MQQLRILLLPHSEMKRTGTNEYNYALAIMMMKTATRPNYSDYYCYSGAVLVLLLVRSVVGLLLLFLVLTPKLLLPQPAGVVDVLLLVLLPLLPLILLLCAPVQL